MHMYKKALLIHQNYRWEMEVRMEPYRNTPARINQVNIFGQWKPLAAACGFTYTKVIRFKYVSNGEDVDAENGQNRFSQYSTFVNLLNGICW